MRTYLRVADLPLEVDAHALEGLERSVSSAFVRRTTVVRLRGRGEEGVGEDVTYDGDEQAAFQAAGGSLPLAGRHTVDSFSRLVGGLSLFEAPPRQPASVEYRRWALESAALDLALRQAGLPLAGALGREPRPVRFVVSLRLDDERPALDPIRRLLERYPGTRFKLDPTPAWDDALCAELAALDVVDTLDLKGAYEGVSVGQDGDAALYRRVAGAFPAAWLEDPDLAPGAAEALAPHRERITWDAPIHSVEDVESRPRPLRTINVKPSRFGSLERLLDAYDHCEARGIGMYGGGQFELGPGRGQIQLLAALFHPDAPNDVAPAGYNVPDPPSGLPLSPLDPAPEPIGFRRSGEG